MGAWTILPLLSKIRQDELSKSTRSSWYVFVQDETRLDLAKLSTFLQTESPQSDTMPSRYSSALHNLPRFLGFAQSDDLPTIIHHFASDGRLYPLLSTGFAVNRVLFDAMSLHFNQMSEVRDQTPELHGFSIDAAFELAKFVHSASGALLENRSGTFCLQRGDECATWLDQEALFCPNLHRNAREYECAVQDGDLSLQNVYFAVKTCERYHKERARGVLDRTWIRDVRHYDYYAEFGHPDHVINVEVTNVLQGHCRKTMRILELVNLRMGKHNDRQANSAQQLKWLVLADDDTLLNASSVLSVLRHFDADKHSVLIGERYGFGVHEPYGFDFLSGGSAIAISRRALGLIRERAQCACAKVDEPDDMRLGECVAGSPLFNLVHSALFHQNQPDDYSFVHRELVRHRAVSFHHVTPQTASDVYELWLNPAAKTLGATLKETVQIATVKEIKPTLKLEL